MGLKEDFQREILRNIDKGYEYIIVKPNWVSCKQGHFTKDYVLDWVLGGFPDSKKIVIESFTPWRDDNFNDKFSYDLDRSKEKLEEYKRQDGIFFEKTGINKVFDKHGVEYVNITEEVWMGNCAKRDILKDLLDSKNVNILNEDFLDWIPSKLFDTKDRCLFINLARIKLENNVKQIGVSMGIKNLFGLIPHPNRKFFHGDTFCKIRDNIWDIFNIYDSIFEDKLSIIEGFECYIEDYCSESEKLCSYKDMFYIGRDAFEIDLKICEDFGVKLDKESYLRLPKN